jgi:hypothetical protein
VNLTGFCQCEEEVLRQQLRTVEQSIQDSQTDEEDPITTAIAHFTFIIHDLLHVLYIPTEHVEITPGMFYGIDTRLAV